MLTNQARTVNKISSEYKIHKISENVFTSTLKYKVFDIKTNIKEKFQMSMT